jgi:hypothetical protein
MKCLLCDNQQSHNEMRRLLTTNRVGLKQEALIGQPTELECDDVLGKKQEDLHVQGMLARTAAPAKISSK